MEAAGKIDIYCERVDPSFWAEPLNAVSNLAFIVAALVCWRVAGARRKDRMVVALAAILFAIGVGSFLWHTVAERWAGAADTIPILVFILVYLFAATRRFFGAPLWAALAAPAVFVGFSAAFAAGWNAVLPSANGSEGYFPVFIVLAGYGFVLGARGHPAARGLLTAAALFAVSLAFRSIDDAVCGAVPIGTHFLWHTLNGLLLGVVLTAFIRHGAPGDRPVAPPPAQG